MWLSLACPISLTNWNPLGLASRTVPPTIKMAATVDILPLMPFRFFDLPPELRCLILEESKEYIRLRKYFALYW